MANWDDDLDDRQKKEIAFARNYVANFNHGASGHNSLNVVASLSTKLDNMWRVLNDQGKGAEAEAAVNTAPPNGLIPSESGKGAKNTGSKGKDSPEEQTLKDETPKPDGGTK